MKSEESLKQLKSLPIDENNIDDDFEYIANKLEISVQDLKTIMQGKNKTFRDYKSNYLIINFFTKMLRLLKIEKRIIQ